MIDQKHRRKLSVGVTVFAHIGGLYVREILPGCVGAVVTANAVADYVYVAERRG